MKVENFLFVYTIFTIFFCCDLFAQSTDEYSFQYYSTNDGLTQNEVTSIVQDNYGFMWFGTRGGLNRFDGNVFKRFKPEANQHTSLNNPSIERLFVDKTGKIWIGTKSGGYSLYNPSKEEFIVPQDTAGLIPERIISFEEDGNESIWYGSWDNGAYLLSNGADNAERILNNRINSIKYVEGEGMFLGKENGLFQIKSGEAKKLHVGINGREVVEVIKDKNAPVLWMVGWSLNLFRVNLETLESKEYKLPSSRIQNSNAYSLTQDRNGNIWVGTWGNGLLKFNVQSETFEQIVFDIKDVSLFDLSVILDVFEDSMGNIWVGTDGCGIVRISTKSKFSTLKRVSNTSYKVNDLMIDLDGNLWAGTSESGLLMRDTGGTMHSIPFKSEDGSILNDPYIRMVKRASDGSIWVSAGHGLYNIIKKNDNNYEIVSTHENFENSVLRRISKVHDIEVDGSRLWVATQQNGILLFEKCDDNYKLVRHFYKADNRSSLKNDRVTALTFDSLDRMVVASYGGLMVYNPTDSVFVSVNSLIKGDKKPLCDIVIHLVTDNQGNIWFSTPCSLNKLTPTGDGEFVLDEYSGSSGLSDDYVNAIIEDNEGYIWVSTNAGISRLLPQSGEIRNYDTNDGVGDTDFSEGACAKGVDGSIYFGGAKMITSFKPTLIREDTSQPPIVITDFRILNKPVLISDNDIISNSINEVDDIVLGYKEKEFSFEFSVLDYKNSGNSHYAYRLEGYDEGWNKIGNRRHVSFNNLEPSEYKLHLKGTNSHGVWNSEVRTINIKVLSPPWKTWYAILIYVIIIIGIVMMIIWVNLRQERLYHAVNVEKMERNQEKEMSEYKFRFFTNISHELRTPLTLILGPIKELIQADFSDFSKQQITGKLELIHHNTNRLYSLVNQLLEFRKVEAGKLVLQVGEYALKPFVKEIFDNYKGLAISQQIDYFINNNTLKKIYFDKERISVVLNNLLSNAFKYVDAKGVVNVGVDEYNDRVEIKVSNSGTGITAEDQKHLFDRFYQAEKHQHVGSSGIGLSLASKYVKLHQGELLVESIPNGITTFTVVLREGKEHFGDAIFIRDEDSIKDDENIEFTKELIAPAKTRSVNSRTKGATVLIVEDNKDVQLYLSDLLSSFFNVVTANNGFEGFEVAVKCTPELIISDVMMPQMDGFELCEKIKNNDKLFQVPVLLLTAKNTSRDLLYGTKKGADAYITKPFEPELLIEKSKQLISSRVKLSEKYSKKVRLEPTDKDLNKKELDFINKVVSFIEKKMDDSGFDTTELASEMAMSSSTFYRRLKQLTNMSPGEFVRNIKLKRAAQLLEQTNLSVSEIIDEIGYADTKTFRKNFKEMYDMLPSEYRKRAKQKDGESLM